MHFSACSMFATVVVAAAMLVPSAIANPLSIEKRDGSLKKRDGSLKKRDGCYDANDSIGNYCRYFSKNVWNKAATLYCTSFAYGFTGPKGKSLTTYVKGMMEPEAIKPFLVSYPSMSLQSKHGNKNYVTTAHHT
ncbi:uncharacterized protein BDZ99DRAFT_572789 [Mytilinidion resinicola]|uniref:Uncharacterized protein n=1 Tax=Mytilinidion resinicola TaxID=574789 RepID=A0A6A6YGG6_9PEZI|nr:uncharacterized protein BDZ99DRAFT_572789 [Mytilinidion resinicola]KAF2807906.1 hypothetical protein BDZ99DRAFT_572789 [Mytilinidion resinicola]